MSPALLCFCLLGDGLEPTPVQRDVAEFERRILSWVEVLGTDEEKRADALADAQRRVVVKYGEDAIPVLLKSLRHDQVNVRRGVAIALVEVVEASKIVDRTLINVVLTHVVEDPDIKCRSNLSHVLSALLRNERGEPHDPRPAVVVPPEGSSLPNPLEPVE